MAVKRAPLPPALATKWAQHAHVLYLEALMSEANWTARQIAFHGGTSLHLSWGSPRYSEDLDFLLSKEIQQEAIEAVSRKVAIALRERFTRIDPQFVVEVRGKTKDPGRMVVDHVVVSHPAYIGSVMAKAEFWRVEDSYLANYPIVMRTPVKPDDLVGIISSPVPAASLATAFADKLTAFATRPVLKWRDVFDLWWIGTQASTPGWDASSASVASQYLHNVSAYATRDSLSPADALRLFAQSDREAILAKADPDLRKWLPAHLWTQLGQVGGVEAMVDYVRSTLNAVAAKVDAVSTIRSSRQRLSDAPDAIGDSPAPHKG